MFLLYFLQKQHVSKNLVLELWTKNLKTNQNAGFFKPQYLTKNMRYEVELLDMIRGPRSGCAQARLNMPKGTTNSESALSQE